MEPPKWRIAKACQECRAKKIRCDGGDPCQRCKTRRQQGHEVQCVYRTKARNRVRKSSRSPASSAQQTAEELDHPSEEDHDDNQDDSRGLENHSVAATHRASPSMLLQLYYGPSSNFSIMNFIYHQIEGTRPVSGQQKEVQEMGPGLDHFNIRRLYFGDLADNTESLRMGGDTGAMFVDRDLASRLLERYLATYWHIVPIWSKDEYRCQLARLYVPSEMFSFDNPDTLIVLLAMAMGASTLQEEAITQSLFRTVKRWMARLDEMVNVQAVQLALLMSHFHSERAKPNSAFLMAGTAVRKALGAGLHKDITGTAQSFEDTRKRRITIWSLFFWETWLCFSLGRPSSLPESEMRVPLPAEQKFLQALVALARLMSKCGTLIYKQHHKSLTPIWNAANEIRREFQQFAEQQRKDLNFGLVGDPRTGELGVCQTIMSTMYFHSLALTFRPFLVLRAKMRQESASCSGTTTGHSNGLPTPPPWLDTACEYCLDATRHSIAFLAGACEQNVLCREITYHAFFIEGAAHILILDLLQDRAAGRANLPWIRSAIRIVRRMLPSVKSPIATAVGQVLADNLERTTRSVYPDFRATPEEPHRVNPNTAEPAVSAPPGRVGHPLQPPFYDPYPSMLFGIDAPSSSTTPINTEAMEPPADLTPADGGWNFDFATADMEAFLSIDPNMSLDQLPTYYTY